MDTITDQITRLRIRLEIVLHGRTPETVATHIGLAPMTLRKFLAGMSVYEKTLAKLERWVETQERLAREVTP